jgi:hypothetical protein
MKVIYDAEADRIWIGYAHRTYWNLIHDDGEVYISARTRTGLKLPTDRLFIIGDY